MIVSPAKRRSIVREVCDGVEITIPAKWNIFLMLFLAAWLVGWGFGEFTVVNILINGPGNAPQLFLGAWLFMWTIGGGFALYMWLWMTVGKEIIHAGQELLAIKRDVLGFGRLMEYEWTHVFNLRASVQVWNPFAWNAGMQFWGVSGGAIAFDHGATTIRFGVALDEAEAQQLVKELKSLRESA